MALLLRLRIPAIICFASPRCARQTYVPGAHKHTTMGKRKQDTDSEPELDSEELDEEETKKPKKRAAPRKTKPKFTEPFVDELGWNVEPPSIIWRDFGTEPSDKIAAFDLVSGGRPASNLTGCNVQVAPVGLCCSTSLLGLLPARNVPRRVNQCALEPLLLASAFRVAVDIVLCGCSLLFRHCARTSAAIVMQCSKLHQIRKCCYK